MSTVFSILFGLFCLAAANVSAQDSVKEPSSDEVSAEVSAASSAIVPSNAVKATDSTEDKDIENLKNKAAEGDVEAQLNLGYIYLYGANGTNIDYKQALSYYEAAAAQNNPVALNNLGSLYFSGIGTDVDYAKALHFFEEAAKQGSSDAAVNLAIIYLGADDKDKTPEKFTKIFDLLKQAQKDNTIAKYLLGYSYLRGFGTKQNYSKAFQLIKPLADEQYDEAQFVLAEFYINGRGATKNYNRAIQYLQSAVTQGNLPSMMQLASILTEGKIYPKDIKKAHILYNVASVMGADGAAEKRDALEETLSIEDLLAVQSSAEDYKPEPSEKTKFIRQTYGESLKLYIDNNINALNQNKNESVN